MDPVPPPPPAPFKKPISNKAISRESLPDFSILDHSLSGVKKPLPRALAIVKKFFAYFIGFLLLIGLLSYGLFLSANSSVYSDVLNGCYITIVPSQAAAKQEVSEIKQVLDLLRKDDFPDYKNVCKNVGQIKTSVTLCTQSGAMGCTRPDTRSIEVAVGIVMPNMEAAQVGGAIVHESCHISEYKTGYTGDMEPPCYSEQYRAQGFLSGAELKN